MLIRPERINPATRQVAIDIKICGITRPEDAEQAGRLGAHAVGLMFAAASPRVLDLERARAVIEAVPPFVSAVGVFMDTDPGEIETILAEIPLDLLQFHGSEAPAECRRWGRRYLKAVPMAGNEDPLAYMARYPDAAGFLLDAHAAGEAGGKGNRFDWGRVPSGNRRPVILAGGLNPSNVAEAIGAVRPAGLDVSSGVESAPGVKDSALMRTFIQEAQRAAADQA